jgi:CheY-like chemotaxis protein
LRTRVRFFKMTTREELEHELQDALGHLYDPGYQPSGALCSLVGCDTRDGALAVQAVIVRAVKSMEPPRDTPSGARVRLIYDLLYNRYIVGLTQEETAERLHMSVTSVWRLQREAAHALAILLWERSQSAQTAMRQPEAQGTADAQAPDWQSQVRLELESLRTLAPNSVSDVAATLCGVLEMESALVSSLDMRLDVGYVQPNLVAAVHPSALRQMVIAIIRRLAEWVYGGRITIYARLKEGNVEIAATGTIDAKDGPSGADLTCDVLVPDGATVEACIEGDHAFLWITVPSPGQIDVLAIDDNPDMGYYYRRCTTGTRYRVTHVTSGREALQTIRTQPPDVIVLDVMLPDIDGWKLLVELHEDHTTRPIPIIVCSVVKEEKLAYSLGASLYLPKPIDPGSFTQALAQVYPQVPGEIPRAPTNRGATG